MNQPAIFCGVVRNGGPALRRSLDMRVAHLDADIYLMYDPARPGDIVAATARRGGGIWSRLARARHKRHKRRKRKPLTWEDHIRLRDALRARG